MVTYCEQIFCECFSLISLITAPRNLFINCMKSKIIPLRTLRVRCLTVVRFSNCKSVQVLLESFHVGRFSYIVLHFTMKNNVTAAVCRKRKLVRHREKLGRRYCPLVHLPPGWVYIHFLSHCGQVITFIVHLTI